MEVDSTKEIIIETALAFIGADSSSMKKYS